MIDETIRLKINTTQNTESGVGSWKGNSNKNQSFMKNEDEIIYRHQFNVECAGVEIIRNSSF